MELLIFKKHRAHDEATAQLERLEKLVAVEPDFEEIEILLTAPPEFARVSPDKCSGEMYWRDLYHDEAKTTICFQNKWKQGAALSRHSHPDQFEYFYILKGELELFIETSSGDMRRVVLSPNECEFRVDVGQVHEARAVSDCEFIVKFIKAGRV